MDHEALPTSRDNQKGQAMTTPDDRDLWERDEEANRAAAAHEQARPATESHEQGADEVSALQAEIERLRNSRAWYFDAYLNADEKAGALAARAESAESSLGGLLADLRGLADEEGHSDGCRTRLAFDARCNCWKAPLRAVIDKHATPEAQGELEGLRRWKAEASEVILGLQDLGRALGIPLGERITGMVATEKAERLRAENERLRERLVRERQDVEGLPRYALIFNDEVAEAFAEDDPARMRTELVQVAAVAVAWVEKIDRDSAAQGEARSAEGGK